MKSKKEETPLTEKEIHILLGELRESSFKKWKDKEVYKKLNSYIKSRRGENKPTDEKGKIQLKLIAVIAKSIKMQLDYEKRRANGTIGYISYFEDSAEA